MARRQSITSERADQEALVEWFKMRYPELILAAIPNGLARPNSAAQGIKGGLKPGMPDLMLCHPSHGYAALFIELKRRAVFDIKQGVLSREQEDVLRYLNDHGYLAIVCYGWSEAAEAIERYLNG